MRPQRWVSRGRQLPIARAWRDQRLLRIGGGTTETMKYYIAKLMGM